MEKTDFQIYRVIRPRKGWGNETILTLSTSIANALKTIPGAESVERIHENKIIINKDVEKIIKEMGRK